MAGGTGRRRAALVVGVAAIAPSCASDRGEARAWLDAQLVERVGHAPRQDSSAAAIPPDVALEDGLSADEAVAIALWNDPAFLARLAEIGIARADLAQAGRLRNPTLSLLFALDDKPFEATLAAPIEALFTRGARTDAARAGLDATCARVVDEGVRVAVATRLAHAELAAARELAGVAVEIAAAADRLAELESARGRAGDASVLQVAAVQSAALDAAAERDRAALERELAATRLRARFGEAAPLVPIDRLEVSTAPIDPIELDVARLLELAGSARPDVRARALDVEAARRRVDAARAGRAAIAVIGDLNDEEHADAEIGPGIALELPLFDAGDVRIDRAAAELELAQRQLESARIAARIDVEAAFAELCAASTESRRERDVRLPLLEARHAAASGGLERGVVSRLALAHADLSLLEARRLALRAELAWQRASARLEFAVASDPRRSATSPASPRGGSSE